MPRVSVIMPVYNNAAYVQEAIQSILNQTYTDFELIIIDDGSTDGSAYLVSLVTDPRVKKVFHQENKGLVFTLNEGLDMATGDYIARMDSDDHSVPERLSIQVSYMDDNPSIDLCGSAITYSIGRNAKINPVHHEEIKAWLLFHCCICHPTVMMRNRMINRLGIRYDVNYPHAEDYELWDRLASQIQMTNLPINLHYYRLHDGQVSNQHKVMQAYSVEKIHQRQFSRLGLQLSAEENQIMHDLIHFRVNHMDYNSYTRALGFASWVLEQNRIHQVYNQEMLNMVFSRCISVLPY
ncbi:glycosyltransferase [Paenibacillus donghaensis]|uniref:glycosyltransferase family 2 protein n=1 Tax=Paenibacillus donghaensis TaxID=414771 RepID=UPI001883FD3C|nr:glycosyltransferase [Paenibacillus donghaensis]MBE9913083.1 glycosyltransferase [Paenibacillus donghaensis]